MRMTIFSFIIAAPLILQAPGQAVIPWAPRTRWRCQKVQQLSPWIPLLRTVVLKQLLAGHTAEAWPPLTPAQCWILKVSWKWVYQNCYLHCLMTSAVQISSILFAKFIFTKSTFIKYSSVGRYLLVWYCLNFLQSLMSLTTFLLKCALSCW